MLFAIISSSLVHQYHLVQHDDKDVRNWDQLRIRLLEAVSDLLGGNLLNAEMWGWKLQDLTYEGVREMYFRL